jgi:hypothetical protein
MRPEALNMTFPNLRLHASGPPATAYLFSGQILGTHYPDQSVYQTPMTSATGNHHHCTRGVLFRLPQPFVAHAMSPTVCRSDVTSHGSLRASHPSLVGSWASMQNKYCKHIEHEYLRTIDALVYAEVKLIISRQRRRVHHIPCLFA